MSRNVKTIGLHIFGWLLFASLILGFMTRSPDGLSLPRNIEPGFLLFLLIYAALFYLNAYVLIPKLYLRQQYVLYSLLALLLFAAIYFAKPYEHLVVHPGRTERVEVTPPFRRMQPHLVNERRGPERGGPVGRGRGVDIVSVVLFLSVLSGSAALRIFGQWRLTERRVLQAEKDKVQAELSFLKAQINPHFLFNTLNNIYSLAIAKREETPTAILKLSEMLHYITDDVRADFVPLQSEVDCMRNYIELQKFRLTDKVDVQFEVTGDLQGKAVPPLLFMTFIENAFKYGISSHEPCAVRMGIRAGEQSIDLFCRNKVMVKASVEERTGVGINNAKKRLNYLYPGKYLLRVDTEANNFFVRLTIPV